MLADLKPEVKSEMTQLAEDEINKAAEQLQAFHKALKSTPTPLQLQIKPKHTSKVIEESEESLINFGWATLDNETALPFILRDSESYVADKICEGKLTSRIYKVFSKKFLECFTLKGHLMTKREADVFNEINVKHCDKSLVGDHKFKAGEYMSQLDDIKHLIKFIEACQNIVCFKKKLHNDMFGFLRIAGESEVPFVWSEGRHFLPLFYFDGESEYLRSKAVDLTDKWKITYLKFCCVIQNIRKDHYERGALKVVDFKYLKELFPENTKFELCSPKEPNQELLAPEIRVAALHGMQATVLPSVASVNQQMPDLSSWLRPTMPATVPKTPKVSQSRVASKRPGGNKRPTVAKRTKHDHFVGGTLTEGLGAAAAPRQAVTYSSNLPVTSPSQITNVPHTSPLTASSPELRLSSPMITEAVTTADYNCGANSLYAHILTGNSSNSQQQRSQQQQWAQKWPQQDPRSATYPYSTWFQNVTATLNRDTILQPNLPDLRAAVRSFLVRFLRSMDGRDVGSKIRELTWTFMLEQKMEAHLSDPVMKEMHRSWLEIKPYFQQQQRPSNKPTSQPPVCSTVAADTINITNVMNVIQANDNQYPTSSFYINNNTPSNNVGINASSFSTNNWESRIEVPEHLYFLWPEKESYPYMIRECPVKKQNILGISLSPIVNEFLVNLSEVIIRCLHPSEFSKFCPSNFKKIYTLNAVQNAQWRQLLQSGRAWCVGTFKEIFVSYNEVLKMSP